MAESPSVETCCKAIIALVLATGLTALFIWLGLRGFEPACILNNLDVPTNSTTTTSSFVLTLTNKRNKDTGVYYDPLNLTFSDKNDSHTSSATLPGFHQGGGKTTKKSGTFEANGSAIVRVEMKTQIRYRIVFWKTKRHPWEVGADVSLDADGSLVLKKRFIGREKGVKLTSGAGPLDGRGVLFRALVFTGCLSFLY